MRKTRVQFPAAESPWLTDGLATSTNLPTDVYAALPEWPAQRAAQAEWLALWPCSKLAACGPAVEVTCAASAVEDLAMSISQIRGSIVVSISACHAEGPGSIPGRGGPRALRWPGSPHQPGSGCGAWPRWVFPAECTGAVACSMALLRFGDRWALPGDDLRRMQSR